MKNVKLILPSLAGLIALTDAVPPSGGSFHPHQLHASSRTAQAPSFQDPVRQDTTKTKRSQLRSASTSPRTDLTLHTIIPPSPTAMDIVKGINYPVDLSSGLLNIEIPLYEIVSGDIHIPITLSYHASGLKPGVSHSTWLPQGWSLSVGPTLSRIINGGPSVFYKERIWTGNSMVGLTGENGSSVVYPCVMETVSSDDGGEDIAGAILHRFNVSTQYLAKMPGTTLVSDPKAGWMQGYEAQTTVLGGSSASTSLSEAASTTYAYSTETPLGTVRQVRTYKGHRVYGTDEMRVGEQYRAITHHGWNLTTGRKLMILRGETTTESNGSISTSETIAYDSYNNVSQRTVTGSTRPGSSSAPALITKYYYPQDVSSSVNTAMVSANMVGVPVKVEEYSGSVASANRLTTLETEYQRAYVGPSANQWAIYVPSSETLSVDANASDSSAPSSGERKLTFGTYDSRGNQMERTGLDGRTEVVLWGYRGSIPWHGCGGRPWQRCSPPSTPPSSTQARRPRSQRSSPHCGPLSPPARRSMWRHGPGTHSWGWLQPRTLRGEQYPIPMMASAVSRGPTHTTGPHRAWSRTTHIH